MSLLRRTMAVKRRSSFFKLGFVLTLVLGAALYAMTSGFRSAGLSKFSSAGQTESPASLPVPFRPTPAVAAPNVVSAKDSNGSGSSGGDLDVFGQPGVWRGDGLAADSDTEVWAKRQAGELFPSP